MQEQTEPDVRIFRVNSSSATIRMHYPGGQAP
jgi:hypothetical protein